jgi:hypothetical protein
MKQIISMTVLPTRFLEIEPCITSLKRQGYPLFIFIPKYFRRKGVEFNGNIPSYMYGAYIRIVEDEGSITKLLPALRDGFEQIVTADDDVVYPDGWADGLFDALNKYDSVVCYRGRKIKPNKRYKHCELIKNLKGVPPRDVNFITGVRGVAYKSKWFDDSIYEIHKKFPLVDDVVISAHLYNKGIPMKVISMPGDVKNIKEAYKIDGLYLENNFNSTNNDEAIKSLYKF